MRCASYVHARHVVTPLARCVRDTKEGVGRRVSPDSMKRGVARAEECQLWQRDGQRVKGSDWYQSLPHLVHGILSSACHASFSADVD
jgi:hypothetical protein